MKKQRRIRAMSILLTFLFFLSSNSTVFAAAADTIASIPEKGKYYGKDINEKTEKVAEVSKEENKSKYS